MHNFSDKEENAVIITDENKFEVALSLREVKTYNYDEALKETDMLNIKG